MDPKRTGNTATRIRIAIAAVAVLAANALSASKVSRVYSELTGEPVYGVIIGVVFGATSLVCIGLRRRNQVAACGILAAKVLAACFIAVEAHGPEIDEEAAPLPGTIMVVPETMAAMSQHSEQRPQSDSTRLRVRYLIERGSWPLLIEVLLTAAILLLPDLLAIVLLSALKELTGRLNHQQ